MVEATLNPIAFQRLRLGGADYAIVEMEDFDRLRAMARIGEQSQRGESGALRRGAEVSPLATDGKAMARRLLSRRRHAGLSQAELARRAGVRVETLNRIERGKVTPDFSTIRKLVVALNASKA